jgi:hypothetical protein
MQMDFLKLVFVRHGQFLTPATAASSQYATAVSGGHTLTKSMLVAAFTLRRLKGAFHISSKLDCKGNKLFLICQN